MRLVLAILGSVSPLLLPTTRALAADVHVCPVGCPYSTIQGAVNGAASGDVIHIGAGRYVENVKIIGKRLTLIGESAATTEVDGQSGVDGPVFTLGSGVASYYHLIKITGLTVAQGLGGGVLVQRGAYLHLYDSVVTGNLAFSGGGIFIATPGGPATTVTGCLIAGNRTPFTENGTPSGGGVFVANDSSVVISASTITRNQAGYGGGVYSDTNSHLTLDHTTVSENEAQGFSNRGGTAPGSGGGLYVASSLSISDSVIADNLATGVEPPPDGGGLTIFVEGKQTISNTIIARNIADPTVNAADGGGITAFRGNGSAALFLDRVYVVENQAAPGFTGGIANGAALVLTHTIVADNSGFNCTGGTGCPP
jgi:hypothetical protein